MLEEFNSRPDHVISMKLALQVLILVHKRLVQMLQVFLLLDYPSSFSIKMVVTDHYFFKIKQKNFIFQNRQNWQQLFVGKLKTFQNQPKNLAWVEQKLKSTLRSNEYFL